MYVIGCCDEMMWLCRVGGMSMYWGLSPSSSNHVSWVDEMGRITWIWTLWKNYGRWSQRYSAWPESTRVELSRAEVCVELCARIDLRYTSVANPWMPKVRLKVAVNTRPLSSLITYLMKRRWNDVECVFTSLNILTFIFFFGSWVFQILSMMFRKLS